jgi:hypothetical protein
MNIYKNISQNKKWSSLGCMSLFCYGISSCSYDANRNKMKAEEDTKNIIESSENKCILPNPFELSLVKNQFILEQKYKESQNILANPENYKIDSNLVSEFLKDQEILPRLEKEKEKVPSDKKLNKKDAEEAFMKKGVDLFKKELSSILDKYEIVDATGYVSLCSLSVLLKNYEGETIYLVTFNKEGTLLILRCDISKKNKIKYLGTENNKFIYEIVGEVLDTKYRDSTFGNEARFDFSFGNSTKHIIYIFEEIFACDDSGNLCINSKTEKTHKLLNLTKDIVSLPFKIAGTIITLPIVIIKEIIETGKDIKKDITE